MKKYLGYIIKLLPEILFLPFYWFSFFSPRSEKVWVFGEWHGQRYSDNSKYLFEYVCNNVVGVKAVWITKDKNLLKIIKEKNLKAYRAYSFLGFYYSLKAKLVFITHDAADVNHYLIGGSTLINLTHGVPLKHLGKDAQYKRFGILTESIEKYILPLLPLRKQFNYILCANELSKPRFESAFDAKGKVFSIGYPRWDGLNNDKSSLADLGLKEKYSKIVLYAPTLRFNNHIVYNPFDELGFDNLLRYFEENNILFIFRPHPVMSVDNIDYISNNFLTMSSRDVLDINDLFLISDLLITDYSSVMFDFHVLNKPIYYFVPDLDTYLNEDVGIYGDFYLDALGPIATSWRELGDCLKSEAFENISVRQKPEDYFSHLVYQFIDSHILKNLD